MKMKNILIMLSLALMLQVVAVQAAETMFDPSGDDEYKFIFTNDQGLTYNVPLITNEGGIFKYGNDDRDFVFMEGKITASNGTALDQNFTIGHLDYFLLTSLSNGRSHIMRYGNYDAQNNELKFEDLATGNTYLVTFSTTNPIPGTIGSGDLNVGGETFKVHVANASSGIPPLAIDMDANGMINHGKIFLYLETGEIFDLGNAEESVGGSWNGNSWSNTGAEIVADKALVRMYTHPDTFGTGLPSSVQEVKFWVEKISGNEIDITEVSGNGFNLSGTSQFTTYYGETFDLYNSGNEPTTVIISPPIEDTEAPEFVLRYKNSTKSIEVNAVDNSNGTLTTTMSGMSLWDGRELHMYEAIDESNNSVRMDLVYKKEGKRAIVYLMTLGYNQDPSVNLLGNKFVAKTENGKLIQELMVLPSYEVSVVYNERRDESKVVYRDPNNWNGYGVSGVLLLELQTNQGVLDYEAITL
ncbi:hypothetical protein HOF78_03175 [Candidatus Woesearchaeota archaeon]|jgi:hypothetical protein|nr:hypothetical protein [Candidatus Woesearchaeota archaeon]MBT6044628.1 hypothetical protein [Candidatus Woesearchaeota archaeon]